jgi:hypothetical protein
MRNILFLAVAPFALAACGSDVAGACQNYFDGYEACYNEYADAIGTGAGSFALSDTWCDDTYGGMKDKESADYLNCMGDAYAAADCSTADGYTAAATEAGNCTL